MKKRILFILAALIILSLCACQNKASNYIQGKLDAREQNRVEHEQYSKETKGSSVWWNDRYDNRTVNRHLNSDSFGTR